MKRNIKSIPLNLIKLDQENVRFGNDIAQNQREAIDLIMADPEDAKKLLRLAEHIAENGLDPTELQAPRAAFASNHRTPHMNRTVSLLSGLVLLLSYPAVAQEAAASREASSQLSGSQLDTLKQQTSQSDLAQEWGLNQQEWTRYQTLMQGPRGVYSPGIDPLTALGIEARSAEERRRYADLQVQAERRRVEKELAYQRLAQRSHPTIGPRT